MRGTFCLASIALALAACQPGTGVRGPLYQVDPFPSSAPPGTPSRPNTGVNTATGASTPWYLDGGTALGTAGVPDSGFFPGTGVVGSPGTAGYGTLGAFDGGTSSGVGGAGAAGTGFGTDAGTP